MEWWELAFILTVLAVTTLAFIWSTLRFAKTKNSVPALTEFAEKDIEHIFNDEFREELRNRGRLYFENIIKENAMFLQQDLRLTTSQLNSYMKQEVTKTLQEVFTKYEQAITDAQTLAVESIEKTKTALDEQRELMKSRLDQQFRQQRDELVDRFKQNMADVINHYIIAAIGNQIDLNDQLEYILGDLEANKQAILEDLQNGS